jgi:hypothetical protein
MCQPPRSSSGLRPLEPEVAAMTIRDGALAVVDPTDPRPNPAVNPDALSAWLLSLRDCERRGSAACRAGAPVTLYR